MHPASTGTSVATGVPYLVYPELDFKVWTHPDGDSFSRYWVRLQETRESARMVLQMLEQMPAGPIMAKVPRIIKVPEGEAWVETENPLGQMGYYVFSKGATGPFRVKIRSASFSNVSILPWLLRGVFVPDVITILGFAVLHPRGHRPMRRSGGARSGRRSESTHAWSLVDSTSGGAPRSRSRRS